MPRIGKYHTTRSRLSSGARMPLAHGGQIPRGSRRLPPASVAGRHIPAPEAGSRRPVAPVAGRHIPAPEAGFRFPAPVAGRNIPAPIA